MTESEELTFQNIMELSTSIKSKIIDILVYGRLVEAEISMILSLEKHQSYKIEILKMAEKYPFREEQDVE